VSASTGRPGSAKAAPVARPPDERRENRAGLAFVTPALVLIGVFFFLPVVAGMLLSLTDFDLYALGDLGAVRFVGLHNYATLLASPEFWKALANTFYFVLVGGPLSVALSLAAALLLNEKLVRFKGLFRTVYFAPVVTTLVAVAVVWRYLYHPRFGMLNQALSLVGIAPIDWLGNPRWAIPAIIVMAAWRSFGYNMVIFLAGLQAIPDSVYEAARLDGAGPLRRFWGITLPLLRPTMMFVAVMTMIGYFQLFAEPYVLTAGTGGPANATLTIVMLMYKEGFRWWNMGYAAAVAFVLFLVVLAATSLQLALQRGGRE
jgi:multiple sugar transport system permease protein